MTRDEQVALALRILRPEDRDQCRIDIAKIIDIVDTETEIEENPILLASRTTKDKVQALRDALHKVRTANNALPESVRSLVFKDIEVQKHLDACEVILKQPSRTSKPPASKRRLATAGAQALLFDYGMKPTVTRHGPWDRLAAIIYGDAATDMFPYLREHKDID